MRGVFLHPGPHVLQFRYVLPDKPLYVTLTAYGTGLLLLGLLGVAGRGQRRPSIGK